MTSAVAHGRGAFDRRDWAAAHRALSAALSGGEGSAEDLELLAVASYLIGEDDESIRAWERAHVEHLRAGDVGSSARCAFWSGMLLLLRGEMAPASGWLARARSVLDEHGADCAARGYLLVPAAWQELLGGNPAVAESMSAAAGEVATRFGDKDLRALALLGRGEAAVETGEPERGLALLDEAMVGVMAGEVSPIPAGIVYCAVIETCVRAWDLRRAAEWTEALAKWCETQPDLVPFRGQCLVHRSQVLQARGEWVEAATDAQRARERLSRPPHPALGGALYQCAELHRLRGELDEAEAAYRLAGQQGRQSAPGWALLQLARGRREAAEAAIRRMLDDAHEPLARPALLAACIEIMIDAGNRDAARRASDELSEIAHRLDVKILHAMALQGRGSVALAGRDPSAALGALRESWSLWRELGMPYEAARARLLIALTCRAIGDEDAANVELDAACAEFVRLGAEHDLARARDLFAAGPERGASPLTEREREVLRWVTSGRTNREIAAELAISEHTVARHLQNIFTKLGVSSRAAATAYALRQGLA